MIVETDHQKIEWLHGGAMSILLEGDRPTGNSPWSVCAAAPPVGARNLVPPPWPGNRAEPARA
jgi:hypothetical protein